MTWLYQEKGLSYRQIGDVFGITHQRVYQIVNDYQGFAGWLKGQSFANLKMLEYAFSRDCRVCGADAEHVHHKDRNSHNNNPSNVVDLCKNCHYGVHAGRKRGYQRASESEIADAIKAMQGQ